ncbi:MAG: glycosyl hydrolase family 18 protein, partial [Bacteroidales bacterium]
MKRLLPLIIPLLLLTACGKEILPEPEEEVYVPSARIEGKVALAYVTYYGQRIPDPSLLTHIAYAFAELYVSDGAYHGFRLQGSEARFASVAALKNQYPHLKILLSFTHTVANADNSQGGGFSVMAKTDEGRKAF